MSTISRNVSSSRRIKAALVSLAFAFTLGEVRAQARPQILSIHAMPSAEFAQSIDIGRDKYDTESLIDVIVNIKIDKLQNRAPAGLRVQLNSGGNQSLQGGQQTDSNGSVEFHVVTGVFQLTVSGPGIEDYDGTIQITREQGRAFENIIVKSKGNGEQSGGVALSDPASASKFKIPEKAAKEFQAGSKAMDQKDYAEAKKRFSNATVLYADFAAAYDGIGAAQMAAGDAQGARASFQKAIKIDEHFAEAYRNLARLSLADHKFEEVDDLLTKSLQSDPLNAWALTYAAYAELQTQKFDLAITHARAAHSVAHPGLASVHIVAAHAFEATNQPDEALKEYKLYMEEDPTGRDAPRAKQAIASLENPQPK